MDFATFYRQARAIGCFILGIGFIVMGVVLWEDLDEMGRMFLFVLTPLAFVGGVCWWTAAKRGRSRWRR